MANEPSSEELELLGKFKLKIEDVICELPEGYHRSDTMLLNWIRAREGIVKHAEISLRDSIAWRKKNDFYNLHKWQPPSWFVTDFPYEITGQTKEGHPIVVVKFGQWNIPQIFKTEAQKALFLKYFVQMLTKLQQELIEKSQPPNQILHHIAAIIDFDGYSWSKFSVESLVETFQHFDGHFPELLGFGIFINTPTFFNTMYQLILKRFLSSKSISKLKLYDCNTNKWKLAILKRFPADQFPRDYGGCKPELRDNRPSMMFRLGLFSEDMLSISIPPGQELKLNFHITTINSQIRWIFKTKLYDIGFSVLFENDKEIHPYQQCSSHFITQQGSINCREVGTYSLIFDNKYSRLRGKSLEYKVYVVRANNDNDEQ